MSDPDTTGCVDRRYRNERAAILPLALALVAGCSDIPAPLEPLVSEQQSLDQLYLADASGSLIGKLTTGSAPNWSRDGRRIAFHRAGHILVIDANGSNEVRLSAGTWPTWSPDGKRIAFVSDEGISVMNADGSAVRTLIRHGFREDTYEPWDMGVGQPAWSPDGARIAFAHLGDGDTQPGQIFVMNSDGSNPRLVTATIAGRRYAESSPSWSPDGSKLVYWSFGYGIAVVPMLDGVPNALYGDIRFSAKPVWSPDGTRIAFNYGEFSSSARSIWIVPATGGAARPFIVNGRDAAWAPDGARIAFVRGTGG